VLDSLGYVDPMSGAIILQLIVAGVVGAVAFFRHSIWRVVRTIFRIKGPQEDEASEGTDAGPPEAAPPPSDSPQDEASEPHAS
jgi:hypothetical protein